MNKAAALLVLVVLISGCATGYHSQGFTGGYTDIKLQDDIYKVSFKGNGYCGSERAYNMALLRCAEVALNNGYKYFIIIDGKSLIQTSAYTTPVIANTQGTTSGNVNMYNSGYGSSHGHYSSSYLGTTSYSGGETYTFQHSPSASNTIKCFKDKPENISTIVYDAEQIKNNIKAQYNIK